MKKASAIFNASKTFRVRVGDVRDHRHDDPVLGKRQERRDHPAQCLAVVADPSRFFTRKRHGLESPSRERNQSPCRGQPLSALEQSNSSTGCSSVPLLIARPKRTRSDGVDNNTLDPA